VVTFIVFSEPTFDQPSAGRSIIYRLIK